MTPGAQRHGTRWHLTASLGLVVALGIAVRVALLDQVMRNDEVVTATRFAVDIGTAVTNYSAPNNHILHSILVNLSVEVFGLEPWALRLPALMFGLGLIVAVHWWISSATGRGSAGLWAAALVAGSSMLIEYSTRVWFSSGRWCWVWPERVLVESHPRIVLDWYLSPAEPSDWIIHRVYDDADRVFVVVYYPREQDLKGMLDDSEVPVAEFSDPALRWSLPETDIYVMERIG